MADHALPFFSHFLVMTILQRQAGKIDDDDEHDDVVLPLSWVWLIRIRKRRTFPADTYHFVVHN